MTVEAPMTSEQDAHILGLVEEASALMDRKYRAGQAKHGGDLWAMSASELLDNAILEAIDQVVYLLTLRQTLSRLEHTLLH